MISKPQKAPSKQITNEQLEDLAYDKFGSFKLDGYRCTTHNGAYICFSIWTARAI